MAATSVGNLEIVLAANSAGFVAGLEAAKKAMKDAEAKGNKFGSTLSGVAGKIGAAFLSLKTVMIGAVAAVGAYKLVASLNDAAEAVDNLGKTSKRLGIGVEQMSVLKFAAGEAGIEFESLAGAVGKFNKNVGAALGEGASSLSVGSFAIALRDINGNVRSLPSLLADAAGALERVGNEAERADLAEGLFGRDGGSKFLTLLGEGSSFIGNLADQWERARKLNLIFTQDDVDKLTAYNDAIGRIGGAFEGLKVKLMVVVAPALTAISDRFAMLVAAVPNIVKALIGNGLDEGNRAKLQAALEKFGNSVVGTFKVIGGSAAEVLLAAMYDTLRNSKVLLDPVLRMMGREMLVTLNKSVADSLDKLGFKDSAMALLVGANVLKVTDDIVSAKQLLIGLRSEETFQYGATAMAIDDAAYYIGQQAGAMGTAATELVDVAAAFNSIGAQAPDAAAGINGVALATRGFAADIARFTATSENLTFFDGITRGLEKLGERARDVASLGEDMVTTFTNGLSGDIADAMVDAGTSFDDFGKKVGEAAENVGKSIVKMALQFMLMRAVTSGLSLAWSSIGPGGWDPSMVGPPPPSTLKVLANGGAIVDGRLQKFAAGGVVTRPTLFPMANGTGLMGEAGPEGVLPLERIGGKLGVNAAGAGTIVNVIDQRSGGAAPQVSENQGPDGRRMISVLIRDEVRRGMADGSFDRAMTQNFGFGRRATTR